MSLNPNNIELYTLNLINNHKISKQINQVSLLINRFLIIYQKLLIKKIKLLVIEALLLKVRKGIKAKKQNQKTKSIKLYVESQ
jgi:hypothetical protein